MKKQLCYCTNEKHPIGYWKERGLLTADDLKREPEIGSRVSWLNHTMQKHKKFVFCPICGNAIDWETIKRNINEYEEKIIKEHSYDTYMEIKRRLEDKEIAITERNDLIIKSIAGGATISDMAKKFNISKERVSQIFQKYKKIAEDDKPELYCLSVRTRNPLIRAGITTNEELIKQFEDVDGLRAIRCIGDKAFEEIEQYVNKLKADMKEEK